MLRLETLRLAQGSFALRADFTLDQGARLAVMGPSGAGKSTLLMALAGFVPPVSGRVIWQGADLTRLPPAKRPLTVLFQDQNLFPHLTVAQNLGLGLSPNLVLGRDGWRRVAQALDRVGLAGLGTRRPESLSGGQAGRVALARVLLRRRPLLLLDEPFAALGPAMKTEMLELLSDLTAEAGTTVVLVTHDPQDARQFAECISVVSGGEAAAPRPTQETLNEKGGPLAAYLGVL